MDTIRQEPVVFVLSVDGRYFRDYREESNGCYPWTPEWRWAKHYPTQAAAEAVADYWRHRGLTTEQVKAEHTKRCKANPKAQENDVWSGRLPVTLGGVVCDVVEVHQVEV